MKRVLIVVAALLALSTMVTAQSQVKPVVYVGGGLALPLSPEGFSDGWKMGYGFGGGVGIQLDPSMELIGKVFYNTFPLDDDKLLEGTTGITVDGGDFQFLEFGADFKYILMANAPDAKFKPFLIGGLGMTNIKVSDFTIAGDGESVMFPFGDYSETKFSLGAGAGFDYMFSPKAGVWLEARVHVVMTEGDSFTYLPVRAGVKFLFGQ